MKYNADDMKRMTEKLAMLESNQDQYFDILERYQAKLIEQDERLDQMIEALAVMMGEMKR
jgi:hypothetical protein